MDSSESPFSDLDVFCDWSGDPNDPVEVKVGVEVWCKPNTQLLVLNALSPCVVGVVDYSLRPSSSNRQLENPRIRVDSPVVASSNEAPHTPDNRIVESLHPKNTGSTPDPDAASSLSGLESVVVRTECRTAASYEDTLRPNPFARELSVHSTGYETSPSSHNPRKRSASAASLPDSVSDSERPYDGCEQKVVTSAINSPQATSPSKQSSKPSLIPRPVSLLSQNRPEPARVPLPRDSAPVLEADFRRFEGYSPTCQENEPSEHKKDQIALGRGRRTTTRDGDSGRNASASDDNREQDMDRYSTIVSRGSLCDLINERFSLDSDSADNNGEGVPLVPSASPRYPNHVESICERSNLPQLVLVDDVFSIHCPPGMQPAAYKVAITISVKLQKSRPKGWLELVVPGLPPLHEKDSGFVYFCTPMGQGIEFRTANLLLYTLVESCLMGQFPVLPKLVIPLRTCDGRFYGFLKNFKVTHTIQANVVDDKDPLFCVIKYHALCYIDLIQRDLWAEKCGFYIYVYGGPKGEFNCHLQTPREVFQTIHLDSAPNAPVGVSTLQVICSPPNLAMFAVAWEVKLPRSSATTWIPYIRATKEPNSVEKGMQAEYEYAEQQKTQEVVTATRHSVAKKVPSPRPVQIKGPSSREKIWTLLLCLFLLLVTGRFFYRNYGSWSVLGPGLPALPAPVFPTPTEDILAERGVKEVLASATMETIESAIAQSTTLSTSMPLRDQIDYFLGWRGPVADA
ncbi:uncharacterized protein N7459_005357 [Penicillium hispanicum]|uniref:uncharacterized protein n=1 Tax=Penicillium hispanicum TaxID=1080232 RepID=UPI0025420CB2|nr:uncharacterized protein N7459_005357 [Penicillium hispanicum]KAJ5585557.1 hypothetical protein N7459_005357 [Penicillium hispanicum]